MANIVDAIANLVKYPMSNIVNIRQETQENNRMNSRGVALEEFIKDLFADSFSCSEEDRVIKRSNVFSYLGNNNNPPDAMVRGGNLGDAIEIKKLEGNGSLALNSSYPKHTLLATNSLINATCRDCEAWNERDMLYIVGMINRNSSVMQKLCMVYGDIYCASDECYARLKNHIKAGVEAIPNIEFQTNTKELGHINRVDPLGITYMRVRGMWGIENPWKVFSYIYDVESNKAFNFMCIMKEEKWNSFPNTHILFELAKTCKTLKITDKKVKDPDNPANLINVKLITYAG